MTITVGKCWKGFLFKVAFSWHFSHIWYINFSTFKKILSWERTPLQSCHEHVGLGRFFPRLLQSVWGKRCSRLFFYWCCTLDSTLGWEGSKNPLWISWRCPGEGGRYQTNALRIPLEKTRMLMAPSSAQAQDENTASCTHPEGKHQGHPA